MSLILIVEDNERNLKLVRDVLNVKGYETIDSMTGEGGVALAAQRRPDLVLLDIQLPDIDGFQVLAKLRADPTTKAIPVVAVSASVMPSDVQRIGAAGFDGYVTKPISVKGFIETVEKFLGKAKG